MFSTQEWGPREEPHSEVPWDLMGESQERPERGSSHDVCVCLQWEPEGVSRRWFA